MSGVAVYIKHGLMKYVKRLYNNSKLGIFLRLDKEVFGLTRNTILCFIYLPPENSPFYRNTDLRGIHLLESELTTPEITNEGAHCIILGDLNARVSDKADYLNDNHIVAHLRDYEEFLNDSVATRRVSCDKQTNKFGKDLISFCKNYMMQICNGRIGEDKDIGQFTFVGPNGNSVIDYILCPSLLMHLIDTFAIEERTESTHCPVSCKILCYTELQSYDTQNFYAKRSKHSYRFDATTTEQYKDNLISTFTDTFIDTFNSKIEDLSNDINSILNEFTNKLKKCGECCERKIKNTNHTQPSWFDRTCRTLKTEKFRVIRQYRRERNDTNLTAYKEARKKFKSHCDKQQDLHNKKVLEDLVANYASPKSFWNKLKRLTNSRTHSGNSISKAQWQEHFENLFKSRNIANDEGINMDIEADNDDVNAAEIEYDITENELEDYIFNSEITNEEILKSVQDLKRGKSAGPDDLIPEFFINSIDIIIPLLNKFFNRIFDHADYPEPWSYSIIVSILKKGNANDPNNYRGISLLDVLGKIFTSILTRRVTFYTNIFSKISESQAGFRDGYSTTDQAFILYSLIHKYLSKKRGKLYVAFVDLTKAFDSINRSKLWKIVSKTGIKGKLYKNLLSMYQSVKACVRTNEGLTSFFNCPLGLKQGCLASPILFSIFINELATELENSNLRGVQLFPDLAEILLLMFADDLALISDSIIGLQRLLNILHNFCVVRDLVVNTVKTKVVVFKNGGLLSRNEVWSYAGKALEVVPCFTYLGLNFTRQLSLTQMACDQALKGKRVLISLLSRLHQYGQLSKDIYFKLFDSKVSPVLLYGAELWGVNCQKAIETVHNYACKRYMCVRLNASNDAVLGDCGRYPMYINATKRCVKYWLKILRMQDNRYVKKCYTMLKCYADAGVTNWASCLKHILYSNGFGYVWERQSVVNERKFINSLVQRLKDQHIQQWFASIHRNSKLDAYIGFKTVYEHESYLHCVTIRKFRRILAQFRVSAHSFEIERGRYSGVARTDRICKICQSSTEDEYHFVFICDIYKDLRVKYLPREYIISPSVFKFNKLFSDSNEQIQTKLALFLYHAMERRINYIDSLNDNQHQ